MSMDKLPELGRMISYCGHLGKLSNDQLLRQAGYDVTPVQTHLLLHLACWTGEQEASQRDLERKLRLKPSTVNGIVDRLEAKGYVSRRASPQDGRVRLVSLTEAGRSKVQDFHVIVEETERRFTASLSEQERGQLRKLLSRIIENLENEVNSV
ncbi:MAG: MarR family transcriptional regulator [Oscillospiraceae bacterium]|jgi:DNA-binding MarR family transcriptional regulator|nr:MarR family transcriptional regulator [Oscillospiraceae bacterium]